MIHAQSQPYPATLACPPTSLAPFNLIPPAQRAEILDAIASDPCFALLSIEHQISLTTPQREGFPLHSQAQHLFLLGQQDRAARLFACGNYWVYYCPKGTKFKRASHCGLAFCPDCALRRAEGLTKAWEPTIRMLQNQSPDAYVTLVELSIPCPRDRALADALFDTIDAPLASWDCPIWKSLRGFDGQRLLITLLVVGHPRFLRLPDWQRLYPEAQVEVTQSAPSQLTYLFQESLCRTFIPLSVADRAEQEVLFSRAHRFRACNIKRHNPGTALATALQGSSAGGRDFSVVGSKPTTKNSQDPSRPPGPPATSDDEIVEIPACPSPSRVPRCPCCNQRAVQRSQMFRKGTKLPPPEEIRWHKIR